MKQELPAPPRAFGGGEPQSRRSLAELPVRSPRPSLLERPITDLEGVGPKLAQVAARIGVRTLGDLLEHLPFDHRDYERQRLVSRAGGRRGGDRVGARSAAAGCGRRRRRRLTILEVPGRGRVRAR